MVSRSEMSESASILKQLVRGLFDWQKSLRLVESPCEQCGAASGLKDVQNRASIEPPSLKR